jgi:hypothetical protein
VCQRRNGEGVLDDRFGFAGNLEECPVLGEVCEIFAIIGLGDGPEIPRLLVADAKDHVAANVAKDSLPDTFLKLADELVREAEAQTVAARHREEFVKLRRLAVLKFIDVQKVRHSLAFV